MLLALKECNAVRWTVCMCCSARSIKVNETFIYVEINVIYIILSQACDSSVTGFMKILLRDTVLKMLLLWDESEECYKTNPQLGLDEACLKVISSSPNPLTLWTQSEECDKVNLFICYS
jgi:hypothetical protein